MLKNKILKTPNKPGIYLFFNVKKKLIYVGKATSLKNRIKSYFQGLKTARPIETFFNEVADLKWKTTNSVLEAIILEANSIKKFQPKYNVLGKDDKSWNYLVITRDKFPKLEALRGHEFEKLNQKKFRASFGPFPNLNTKATLKILRQLFNYSTCKPNQTKPCFYYQINQCRGVCTGEISAKIYKHEVIRPLILFFSGKRTRLLKSLRKEMRHYSKLHFFEEAGRLRDQIKSLQHIQDITLLNKNFFVSTPTPNPRFSISRIEGYDISNLGSTNMVAGLVVFQDGTPQKNDYRKFKIKTVAGQSDVACLKEVLERRFKHHDRPLPDLFLVDGGLPQVNTAKKVLAENNINRPIVGIAKGKLRKKNDFYLTDKTIGPWLEQNKNLLMQVRDEAHRFALAYQKQTRKIN
jgi:excinuclease ABC subunit C